MSGESEAEVAAMLAAKLRPAWQPAPPAPGEHVYVSFGVRTSPASADVMPALPMAEAMRLVDGLWEGTPEVELRLVTTGDFAQGIRHPDRLVDRPAWVFTYRGTTVVPRGRVPRNFSPPRGVSTVMIDADTGAHILNCQSGYGPDIG
ncbi:hypothetical protein [Pseudonocardia sp. GCM10023141]|uniref:hypothetical protein n=1 Tax=Pseudonocardia sp. GCM10023141 TaxID=3252653 RepID=UPI0036241679